MNIAIVTNTIYSQEPTYISITDALKTRWCYGAGVEYIKSSHNPYPGQHPCWCKPRVLVRFFPGHDWLVWMDADAAPVFPFDLQGFLATVGDRIVMARDINGWNAGVFAIPCNDFGFEFLATVNSHREEPKYQRGFKEQQAMSDMFAAKPELVIEPPREIGWNSYPNIYKREGDPNIYATGHWCLHIPGASDATRERIFREVWNEML